MKIFAVILILIIIVLWRKKNNEEMKSYTYSEDLKETKALLNQKVSLISLLESKLAKLSTENENMKKELDETKRKLDFYKNIEEDSALLNDSEANEDRQQLVEIAANQLLSEKSANNEDFEQPLLDKEQLFICEKLNNETGNFFITGKAGTGKSFLLDVFRKTTAKKHIVLAPTGIAALNVSGATLHSTFGYDNLVKLAIDNISEQTIKLKSETRIVLKEVSTIIIDEISMVRADYFDKIDRILQVINKNDAPFGGKQVLLFGDLFQLPPVASKEEREYLNEKYGGIYFFHSDAYKNGNFSFFELTINHRQKNDADFFDLLNRIRAGRILTSDLDKLNSRVVTDESIYDRFTTLLPKKEDAEKINKRRISLLDTPEYKYQAEVVLNKYSNNNDNLEKNFPISSTLTLKVGALVMMVVNDPAKRWVNGSLGIVKKLSHDSIFVSIDKQTHEIFPFTFTQQQITYENGKITYEDVFSVKQYPIVLAYAITIHKSQGQTYRNIICDIDKCFEKGQAYVALSRCISSENLHLKQKVNKESIRVDECVLKFYQSQNTTQIPC